MYISAQYKIIAYHFSDYDNLSFVENLFINT